MDSTSPTTLYAAPVGPDTYRNDPYWFFFYKHIELCSVVHLVSQILPLYCRIVIRHASFDAARMLAARWKREISLEYLTEEKFVPLSTTDEYFQVPDYGETYPFSVRGQTILLDSCSLAAALAGLPEQTQEEIFLYYFQHLTQKEIGEQSGWTRSTIGRHIQLALKRLKEEMEVLPHE